MPTEFHVHRAEVGTCSFCGKEDKKGYVVTCAKGTMAEAFVCVKDFERLMDARSKAKAVTPS